MKGHIFNLLEEFIVEIAGAEAYESIYDACNFQGDGIFIRPGNYLDDDLNELVARTVDHLGLSVKQAHVSFGKWIFPKLCRLVPVELVNVGHPKTFLLTLAEIHEIELKKIWPDALPPGFFCEDTGSDTMRITYDSPRKMYDLVEGALQSVCDYFDVSSDWERTLLDGENGYHVAQFDMTFSSND